MPIKQENKEDTASVLPDTDDENKIESINRNTTKTLKPHSKATPPSKKRCRSNSLLLQIKPEYTEQEEEDPTSEEQKPTVDKNPKTNTKSPSTSKAKATPKATSSRRVRGPNTWTPEQDNYLTLLRQSTNNPTEIWIKFEQKFHSGKNEKALKNRWFSIKDLTLLSGDEDKLLLETIEEVMGDVAAAIREKFKAKSGKNVTKAFVQKKMKDIGNGVGKAKGGAVENVKEESKEE
ncbi:hypothetical protein H072_6178 [Dactylellina haptotyla CBS 200.50]|uniref:Myb-like domain-containing protein n=1 Tax=Dactylellina haptotyla (strain CBS 200.50) TaxID=1284197 RepID=S8AAS7_DACHA|nr:hypothetical protein H072_6178 [Dactylellina haptotyla CBS 200.50]